MKDLVLLVADKNAHYALKGALGRPQSLGIRRIEAEFRVHPGRDGGARRSGPEVLAPEVKRFQHALLILDWQGCGAAEESPLVLEAALNERLHQQWGLCGRAIVIDPEVDIWMWGSDHALQETIAWQHELSVRDYLRKKEFEFREDGKPFQPKEALEAALREPKLPRSSALYGRIAEKISLRRCTDDSFLRLREQLGLWFGT